MGNPFEAHAAGNSINIGNNVNIGNAVVLNIDGSGHHIEISDGVTLRNITINITGEKNTLVIGSHSNIRGAIHLRQSGSKLTIGSRVTSVAAYIFAMEGKTVKIGDDCMFSSGIYIRNSDEHPIYDIETNLRINEAKDIMIGNAVWIAEGVTLNKGTVIPDGCVIGSRSVVSGTLKRPNSIYVGNPVTLIREGVKWARTLPNS